MKDLHLKLKNEFPDAVQETHAQCGDETVIIRREYLENVADFIKKSPAFEMQILMDLTVVDRLGMRETPRFEVVYHFYSLTLKHRLRIKVRVEEKDAVVPTLTGLWPAADWFEREAWDMFGVRFNGHTNLKRILMYEEFTGHPLRKDYPITKRQPLIGPKN